MPTTPAATPAAPLPAAQEATKTLATNSQPPDNNPAAGGSYLRDHITGALTLITPSTVQE